MIPASDIVEILDVANKPVGETKPQPAEAIVPGMELDVEGHHVTVKERDAEGNWVVTDGEVEFAITPEEAMESKERTEVGGQRLENGADIERTEGGEVIEPGMQVMSGGEVVTIKEKVTDPNSGYQGWWRGVTEGGNVVMLNESKYGDVSAAREAFKEARDKRTEVGGQRLENEVTDNRGNEVAAEAEGTTLSDKKVAKISDPRTMSDAEKQYRGDMLRNAYAVEVAEKQIVSTPEMSARKAAEAWWDANVSEPIFYDTEVGEVEINRNSVESSLAHRYGQAKLDAITSLAEGFENAVYLGTMPDSRERGVVDHYFAYPIIYKGERCYVFCRAMQDANKNRLYVHEVFVADKIKMGDTLQTAASKPHGGISLYKDILANVLGSSPNDSTNSINNTENSVAETNLQSSDNAVSSESEVTTEERNNQENDVKNAEASENSSALGRVPLDEKGEPMFERAESAELGWDALVEFSGGDAVTAKEIADTMVEEKRKELEKAQKRKPQGKTPTEILASKKANVEALTKAEAELSQWEAIAGVQQAREDAVAEDVANEANEANSGDKETGANNLFNYFNGSLHELISKAKSSATGIIKKIIAPTTERLRLDLSDKGVNIDDSYNHVIDNNAIRHTLKNHGGKSEEKRGQVPVTEEDFERLEDVVTNYDKVEVEIGKRGNENIIYSKTYEDGNTIFVEEKRAGRKELAAVTMWKTKNPTRTDANRTEATQISDLSRTSADKTTISAAEKQISGRENIQGKANVANNRSTGMPEYRDTDQSSGGEQRSEIREQRSESGFTEEAREELGKKVDAHTVEVLDRVAKELGLVVRTYEGAAGESGYIKDGVVYVNTNDNMPVRTILGHEMTHRMQDLGAETYAQFKALAVEAERERMGAAGFSRFVRKRMAIYRNHVYEYTLQKTGSEERAAKAAERVTEDYIYDEIAADIAGEIVDNPKVMDKVFRNAPKSVVAKIVDAIKRFIDRVRGLFRKDADNALAAKLDALAEALNKTYAEAVKRSEVREERSVEGDAEKFMFIGEEGAGRVDRTSEASVRMDNLAKAKEWEKSFGELEGNPKEAKRLQEAAKSVRELSAIKSENYPTTRVDAEKAYKAIGSAKNKQTGVEVTFFGSAFNKNHREGGLFEKAIPALKDAFEKSVFAYSEKEQLAGQVRPDGTVHKEHRSIRSFDNYIGKVNIDGKDYYVRYTVQMQPNQNGVHSQMVSNVELYDTKNPANIASYRSLSDTARLDVNRIVDAKLQRFFALASGNAHEFAKAVKFATGWERGKDGKWRYEMPDGEVRSASLAEDTEDVSREEQIVLDGEYGVRFSLRTKQEPRETVDVWKLMRLGEDGLLYPLYIDRNTKGLELNKWYDADAPKIDPVKFAKGNSYLVDWDGNIHDVIPGLEGQATTIKGKKPSKAQIKDAAAKGMRWIGVTPYANGNKCFINIGIAGSTKNAKGEGGVGGFAMRPGWHAGALPSMKQIPGRSDDMVWVKGKIAYGNGAPEEAASNPGNEITTHIPVDGGYMKATSSFNEKSVDWFISGAFMPEEIMSDEDAKKAIDEYNAENGTQVPYDVPRPNGKLYDAKTNSFYQPKEGVVRFSLSEVNEQFNEDLQKQIDGTLPKGHVYQLGRPSDILKSTGIPDLPIEMSASKLLLKASVSYSSDHPFNLEDITNLPQAIQRPIAVFDSKNKVGCKVILVELTSDKGINFVVAMNTNVPKNRYSKESIQINDIRSVYPKDNVQDIVNWINRGDLLRYVDKKKIKEWITQRRSNSAEVEIQNLDVAAKLVQDFENPKISEENLSENSSVRFSLPPTRVENAEGKGGEVYREAYAADLYESRMANGMVQFREAMQDSMASLSEAMKAILRVEGKSGADLRMEEIPIAENAYLGENALSSINQAEAEAVARLKFAPLMEALAKLAPKKADYQGLLDYMMAKHGLERQLYMEAKEGKHQDYAGLTGLTQQADIDNAIAAAQDMVNTFEASHDATDVTELWNKVWDVSDFILSKHVDSGLMSEEQAEEIQNMYNYYIPLRGFDTGTSSDIYGYLLSQQGGVGKVMRKAEGRKSKADDPIANLMVMAEKTIIEANRNIFVKQRFLQFAENHPSDLISIRHLWLQRNRTTGEWEAVAPDIKADDTPKVVQEKIRLFEETMKSLSKQYPDEYALQKDKPNIPYRVPETFKQKEHQVIVKQNGKAVVVTINGNPRVAQAVNGQTNPDVVDGIVGRMLQGCMSVNRWLSNMYTNRNPNFVMSNFVRDMVYSNTMVHTKESERYAFTFHKNVAICNPATMMYFIHQHNNGAAPKSKLERQFHEFIANGGETGYYSINNIEKRKAMVKQELGAMRKEKRFQAKRAWKLLLMRLDEFNRSAELCARFATYVTSRSMGRTIGRSIYDAKEISVNFNKKGSAGKFFSAPNQTKAGQTAAVVSTMGRMFYVFWNAGVQGLTNFGKAMSRKPGKAMITAAGYYALGLLVSNWFNDEEDEYYDFPEATRRNNILFKADDQWISIPLPIELRAIYGLGELTGSIANGKESGDDWEKSWKMVGQLSQVLPLDPVNGEAGLEATFVPSYVKPIYEVRENRNWLGRPIWKENPYNKDFPEWTKAYSNTNTVLVDFAEAVNEATGGDIAVKGKVDLNPAAIEHLGENYLGGLYKTADQTYKMGETIFGDREFDARNFIFLSRIMQTPSDRTEGRKVNELYYDLLNEAQNNDRIMREYMKHFMKEDSAEYRAKFKELVQSPEFARGRVVKGYNRAISKLNQYKQRTPDEKQKHTIDSITLSLKKKGIAAADSIYQKALEKRESVNN